MTLIKGGNGFGIALKTGRLKPFCFMVSSLRLLTSLASYQNYLLWKLPSSSMHLKKIYILRAHPLISFGVLKLRRRKGLAFPELSIDLIIMPWPYNKKYKSPGLSLSHWCM